MWCVTLGTAAAEGGSSPRWTAAPPAGTTQSGGVQTQRSYCSHLQHTARTCRGGGTFNLIIVMILFIHIVVIITIVNIIIHYHHYHHLHHLLSSFLDLSRELHSFSLWLPASPLMMLMTSWQTDKKNKQSLLPAAVCLACVKTSRISGRQWGMRRRKKVGGGRPSLRDL